MHTTIKALAIATVAALIPLAAHAAPILDQQYDAVEPGIGFVIGSGRVGQSFTVGRDGFLDRIELQLFRIPEQGPSTLTLEIQRITDFQIGDVVRSTTLSSTELPADSSFVSFDFLDLDVEIGDVILIVLTSDAPDDAQAEVGWQSDNGTGTYEGGSAFFDDTPTEGVDRGFRTFVEVDIAAVPEPGTLALFGTALFGIALRRRKARA